MGTAGPAGRVSGTVTPPFRRSLAIVIGIDAYGGGIPPLHSAVNDARRVAEVLATAHEYQPVTLFDSAATREAIVGVLANGPGGLDIGPDDRVCFYFAGHGIAIPGDAGPDGFLLPQDAVRGDRSTYLPMTVVHDALVALPCRHMLVILDSCFAGAFRWSGTRSLPVLPEVIHRERYNRYIQDPAWQAIASAAQDQTALDQLATFDALGTRDRGGDPHSPFALALIDALLGAGDVVPKNGGDGLITATELYMSVEVQLRDAVIAAGAKQTPRFWPLGKHGNGEYVFRAPGCELRLPHALPLTDLTNPWRGLKSYERDHSDRFFGRDVESEALEKAIGVLPLLVVLGASGSGKSSLLKAGALPRLDTAQWRLLPDVRPGAKPLESIAAAVATLASDRNPLPPTRPAIVEAVSRWCAAHPGTTLLVVVDQCEELVTLTRTADDRSDTLQLFAELLALPGQHVHVVLTLRSDFEPHFDKSVLEPWWRPARFMVGLPDRQALKAIVEGPASREVLYFDPPRLVETLVDDVANMPGGLPLLSFALSEMYLRYVGEQRADRALTQADYDALGGVIGALRTRADAEHDALDADRQRTMKQLMLRMVTAGADRLAKRRVLTAELEYEDPNESARMQEVLGRLTDHARLIVRGTDSDGEYAEPAHDAVVRTWGTLVSWVDEVNAEPVPLVTRHKLADASREWTRASRKAQHGLLWSDAARGALLKPLVTRHAPWLNRQERAFAARSVRGRRARMAALAVTTAVILALGVVSLVLGLNLLAKRNELEVKTREVDARERDLQEETRLGAIRLLAEDDPTSAAILVRELTRPDDPAAIAAMTSLVNQPIALQVFAGHTRPVISATFNPDATYVLSASEDGTARLWPADGRGAPRVLQGDGGPIVSASFSHDGTKMLTAAALGSVTVFSIRGNQLETVARIDPRPAGRWISAAFSPDDRYVLTSSPRELLLWALDGKLIQSFDGVTATFSPDGRRLVTRPSETNVLGSVRVWRLDGSEAAPDPMRYVEPPTTSLTPSERVEADRRGSLFRKFDAVVFAPDSKSIRAVSEGGITWWKQDKSYDRVEFAKNTSSTFRLLSQDGNWLLLSDQRAAYLCSLSDWTPSAERERWPERCPVGNDYPWKINIEGRLRVAAFSSDGSLASLATGNDADVVRLRDNRLLKLRGHIGVIRSLAFSDDGTRIVTASGDRTVRIWPTTARQRVDIVTEAPFQGSRIVVSPDGRRVLVSGVGGIRVWMPRAPSRTVVLTPSADEALFRSAQFTQDGSQILTTHQDGRVRSWSAIDGARQNEWRGPCTGEVPRVARISPDGSRLAFIGNDGVPIVCSAGSDARVVLGGHGSQVRGIVFNNDGRLAVTISEDQTARIWNVATGQILRTLGTPRERGVNLIGAVISPNDSWVATMHFDGSVRLWPTAERRSATGSPTAEPSRVWDGTVVESLAFSPDSRKVISTNGDVARLWDVDGGPTIVLQPSPGKWNSALTDAAFMPDGHNVVLASRRTELWQLSGARLQAALAAATEVCLDVRVRIRFFGDTEDEAGAAFRKCERDHGRSPAAP